MCCTDRTPSVSVIMGAYNIGSLAVFPEAIQSILCQSLGGLELIICDDGSTDQTWEVLTALARQDSRIRLIRSRRNEGLAAALNRCIAAARGAYIARQDADDISDQSRLEKQSRFLDSHPEIQFVGSDTELFDQNGIWRVRRFPAFPRPEDFLFTMPFVHGALMFRREALRRAGGYRVARETRRTEDYDLLMRMYAGGLRGANIGEPLYRFQEGRDTEQRRKYRYRVDEAVIRWKGFAAMGLMPRAIPYALKPLAVGLLPAGILRSMKKLRPY